jgi:hypothetical protein
MTIPAAMAETVPAFVVMVTPALRRVLAVSHHLQPREHGGVTMSPLGVGDACAMLAHELDHELSGWEYMHHRTPASSGPKTYVMSSMSAAAAVGLCDGRG